MKWSGAARIQPWRHPEREIWADLAHEEDIGAIFALLRLTEPETFRDVGRIERLEGRDLMQGEGAGWAMPAFMFGGPGRFNTATFGCFYVAREIETSVAETVHHQERFLREAASPPTVVHVRVLRADITAGNVLDLRTADPSDPVYDPDRYEAARALGAEAHREGLDGICYRSVRRPPYPCLALYQPSRIGRCVARERLLYLWDGEHIAVERRTPLDW